MSKTAYYNENDPYAAQWLRNLIDAGHIAPGIVDDRSIHDVRSSDLTGFRQCHFFAGIGVWSHALRLAGWPDERPIWTGSCPCQPFSGAGRREGTADPRHLWPIWEHLIRECRPAIILGEQVAHRDALDWLDIVSVDLENTGYAFAAADVCVAGVGGPHWRHRLWWVANATQSRWQGFGGCRENGTAEHSQARAVADADSARLEKRQEQSAWQECAPTVGSGDADRPSAVNGFWRDADWLYCTDEKWRPVEPGTFPLAHGVADRVGKLRAYGNAICPQVAKIFIEAVM